MTQNILDGGLYLCVQSFSNFIGLNQHLCGTQYVYIAYVWFLLTHLIILSRHTFGKENINLNSNTTNS